MDKKGIKWMIEKTIGAYFIHGRVKSILVAKLGAHDQLLQSRVGIEGESGILLERREGCC